MSLPEPEPEPERPFSQSMLRRSFGAPEPEPEPEAMLRSFRAAGTAVRAAGHFMSPVSSSFRERRERSAVRGHLRHQRSRAGLPENVVEWTPEHVASWMDNLGLHG